MHPATIGRYQVLGIAGAGGFATVYEGFDPRLDDRIAIKVLGDNWCQNPDVRRRFRQEAVLLRRAQPDEASNSLIDVFDLGETENGQPFFVMRWADGGSLADRLTKRLVSDGDSVDRADTNSIQHIVSALVDGLGSLHERSIVHRDIKPSNLLIRRSGGPPTNTTRQTLLDPGELVVIGDLGMAKDLAIESSHLSLAGGTHRYMAPEQLDPTLPIDHRADVYACSVVIAELLNVDLTDLHDPVSRVLGRGMADEPDERHDDMATWGANLLAALGGEASDADWSGSADEAAATHRSPHSRRRLLGILAAVALAALLVVGLVLSDDSTLNGPLTLASGETGMYRIEGAQPGSVTWINPSGEPERTDTFEITGRLPGAVRFTSVIGNESTSHEVQITPSPAGPSIDGPTEATRGQLTTYRAELADGTRSHYWLDASGNAVPSDELEIVVPVSDFTIALVARGEDGVERADQIRVKVG